MAKNQPHKHQSKEESPEKETAPEIQVDAAPSETQEDAASAVAPPAPPVVYFHTERPHSVIIDHGEGSFGDRIVQDGNVFSIQRKYLMTVEEFNAAHKK